ncbi:MAG TPA: hypothetical protein VK452_07250 [Dissulfurispiraceae bacterium]|nr:hypothetical protein [Dissulfurispiraceae bacterium]
MVKKTVLSERSTEEQAAASAQHLSSSGKITPEEARPHIRTLLLSNPNYFGTLKESSLSKVLDIQYDTAYEEIGCVGYHPALSRLEAVVFIKQKVGYGGDICSSGSHEYVRFYLSYDNGATWQDQGMASFTAYDIPGQERLEYSVALDINPQERLCFIPNLPKVRAILSWNNPPTHNTPNFVPIWGNVVDANIQVAGIDLIVLGAALAEAKVQLTEELKSALDLNQAVTVVKPEPLSGAELHKLYKDSKVPGHRYLYQEIKKLEVSPLTVQLQDIGLANVDIAGIIAKLLQTDGDTSYEQLGCIGYDPNREALVGALTVKLSGGYSGGLCTAGSQEYVAFWIDWLDGSGWNYAGTASVNVHDISHLPAGGVHYAVYLPVNVSGHHKPCTQGAVTPRVRAILSWATPPPPTNPNYVPVWGNRLETRISVKPGEPCENGAPNIAILGGVGIADINLFGDGMCKSGALFALTGLPTDEWLNNRECPFGGRVVVQGCPSVGYKYRVWIQKFGIPPTMVTNPIRTVDFNGVGTWRGPDSQGFFTYVSSIDNIDNVLAWWDTTGDDLWQIRLEVANMSDVVLGSTSWYNIQLDNTWPIAEIHIDSGGDCKDFNVGGKISGHFVARELNFGAYSLGISPFGTPPGVLSPTGGYVQTALAPGNVWSLDTAGMQPCGYIVGLGVYDLAIVDSGPHSHHYTPASVGFCLRKP